MAVRNFWIEVEIDGRKTTLSGGPRAKDGSMSVTLYVREDGDSVRAVHINCEPLGEKNHIAIYGPKIDNEIIINVER